MNAKKPEGILCFSAHKKCEWILLQRTRLDSLVAGLSLGKQA